MQDRLTMGRESSPECGCLTFAGMPSYKVPGGDVKEEPLKARRWANGVADAGESCNVCSIGECFMRWYFGCSCRRRSETG